MTLTKQELDFVVRDLSALVVGLRVRKVFHVGRDRVALDLGRQGSLFLSGARKTGRVHLAERIHKSGTCPALCGLLRKHLSGSVIVDLRTWSDDRVAEIRFGRDITLVLYVYGRGYALLDAERRLLGASPSCSLAVGTVIPEPDEWVEVAGAPDRPWAASQDESGKDSPALAVVNAAGRFTGQGRELQRQVEAAYHTIEGRLVFEETHRRLSRFLKSRKKKLVRLLERMEKELERRANAEEKQRFADLLLANQVRPDRGADRVVVKDWFQGGVDLTVPLDPRYSLAENAERYYRQARRDRRAAAMALERMQDVRARLSQVETFLVSLDEISGTSDLVAMEERLDRILGQDGRDHVRGRQAEKRRTGKQVGRPAPGRRFVSANGLEIRVGRGAEENHDLTFHWARGKDMWFHVSGRSGPHVVVRVGQGGEMDSETLLDAATLALFYVDKNRQAEGEVLYQRRKFLRPVKKAPGQVLTAGAKTIYLRIDSRRISRLLSQRG